MHAFDRRTDGQTDGRTDGRTDRNLIAKTALRSMQRGKNVAYNGRMLVDSMSYESMLRNDSNKRACVRV